MKYFDAHSHIYLPQFDADREEVLARMRESGTGSIVIGTNLEESRQALALAQQYDFLWASVGIHPNEKEDFNISIFRELARDPKVVAIGECGLDYYRSSGEGQKEKFEAQIALAEELHKPLIVHCRPSVAKAMEGKNAHDDCFSILQKTGISKQVPVVMHFFTGSGELAQRYLDLGCYLSFPGPVTYTDMYDDSIRVCPLERMLVETDAPFAAPVPHRGKRNEPSFVAEVVQKIATLKQISPSSVAEATVANAKKVFGLLI